ncbi:hypothetical protein OU748_002653 [Yersinia enterocolitica]|uniref:hypothetical protein n=1 Tax=Yersinia TaxID=629 RepID=UPI0011A5EAFC|nr:MULTISPECIES: hypothetical protein [Yersinia]EKN3756339.1 hypothetical protein [Yersinia enterocolitica]EKN3796319.1 hypothetical protein [Yersinia enterocolitica]EKN3878650.1 hypothetical protein [Yersinia enterocolitica]EKN4175916.1 hypothetical protein [Yersinia enterocolitica]EKN4811135.1 hypothetical protein [Yersinia enterocolitica]
MQIIKTGLLATLFTMVLISFNSLAEEGDMPAGKVITSLETSLCAEHSDRAKCNRDIAFLVGIASSTGYFTNLCESTGRVSDSCAEAREAYKTMQSDFDKVK